MLLIILIENIGIFTLKNINQIKICCNIKLFFFKLILNKVLMFWKTSQNYRSIFRGSFI